MIIHATIKQTTSTATRNRKRQSQTAAAHGRWRVRAEVAIKAQRPVHQTNQRAARHSPRFARRGSNHAQALHRRKFAKDLPLRPTVPFATRGVTGKLPP
jgi:hypothetical protein